MNDTVELVKHVVLGVEVFVPLGGEQQVLKVEGQDVRYEHFLVARSDMSVTPSGTLVLVHSAQQHHCMLVHSAQQHAATSLPWQLKKQIHQKHSYLNRTKNQVLQNKCVIHK